MEYWKFIEDKRIELVGELREQFLPLSFKGTITHLEQVPTGRGGKYLIYFEVDTLSLDSIYRDVNIQHNYLHLNPADTLNYFYPSYSLVKNVYRRQKERFNRNHFIIGKGELIVKKKNEAFFRVYDGNDIHKIPLGYSIRSIRDIEFPPHIALKEVVWRLF